MLSFYTTLVTYKRDSYYKLQGKFFYYISKIRRKNDRHRSYFKRDSTEAIF